MMDEEAGGMGSSPGEAGHAHRGSAVCERPLVGSQLGEARLGTGRIHSLVNRWIPWCHSEPAAHLPAWYEQQHNDKEEEATGYTEQLRINSTATFCSYSIESVL